jgi:LuxR family transcriptional regulator, maltose regulon positive regulatory protein
VEVLATTYWALARLHRARADVVAGLSMIERAIESVNEQRLTVMRRLLLAERADLLVSLHRLEDAERWAREHRVGEAADFGLPHERECLSLARLRLARGEAAEAVKLLAHLIGPAETAGRCGVMIEILALQAMAFHESGQLGPALTALERALVLGEPEQYVRTFADHGEPMGTLLRQVVTHGTTPAYVARLLAAIALPGKSVGEPGPDLGSARERETDLRRQGVEPLTPREFEVLRLLTGGASNQRIAEALTVSEGTVKAHISHILGKLGAHNRTEAVARAREFRLLEQE